MDIDRTRIELTKAYPDCRVKVAEDERELVAEVSDKFAVAVIEQSLPHFHQKTREVYRVIRGRFASLARVTDTFLTRAKLLQSSPAKSTPPERSANQRG
jgi:hypothetical protein